MWLFFYKYPFLNTERLSKGNARFALELSADIAVDFILIVIDMKGIPGGNDYTVRDPLYKVIVCTTNGD